MPIRLEQKSDYRTVEELTRDAFWNVYVPGTDVHLILHKIRKDSCYIPELAFLYEKNGRIVGNIAFTRSYVTDVAGKSHETITFGPLGVHPDYQNQGIGSALAEHAKKEAARLGYKAILIYGSPEYYGRFGFENSKKFGISRADGKFPRALLALELQAGGLSGVSGKFIDNELFTVAADELEEFEKTFSPKEKSVAESQKKFALEIERFV